MPGGDAYLPSPTPVGYDAYIIALLFHSKIICFLSPTHPVSRCRLLAGAIGYDVWVVKMDAELSDDFLWSTQMGTIAYDEPSAVLVGPDGDVYVVGTTTDSSDILGE